MNYGGNRKITRQANLLRHVNFVHKAAVRKHYRPHSAVVSSCSASGEVIPVRNPATTEEFATVETSSPELVRKTIENAQTTFESGIWSKASAHHKSTILTNLANMLKASIPDLARIESMQTGRVIREMNAQLSRLPEWLEYYAALLRTHQGYVAPTQGKLLNYVQRIPLGVVVQITPFNHPLLIAIKKIAPALAAGNSIIVKPSESAPITVLKFADMAIEAGLPPGVLSVLPGPGEPTGRDIASHPLIKKIDVTAGTQTGRALGSIAGVNLASYTAELGGKAPVVIFNDADLIASVNGAAFASFVASGQTCVSGTRILVQDGIYDQFLAKFLEKVESIRRRMGDPLNPQSMMGTVISQHHLSRIQSMILRLPFSTSPVKPRILTGGHRLTGSSQLDGFNFSRGCFYAPTVITDVDVDDEIWKEEVFGPVVIIKNFADEAEGIDLANASKYGLGAAVWTSDLSRAHRVSEAIEVGLCWVNTHHRNDPSSPWGGMKESGIGRENGIEAFESYTQTKSTIVNIATAEEIRQLEDWFSDSAVTPRRYG